MSPRSRSADSRPQNNLTLARNCLAVSFTRVVSASCKRCCGLEYIDDAATEYSCEKTGEVSSSSDSSPYASWSSPSEPESVKCSCPHGPSNCKIDGLELFTSFVKENYQCFWNPSLVSSVSTLNYRGFLLPSTVLMIGSEYAYEVIRTAYARRIIRPPQGYSIQSLGDVPLIEMSLVCQTKFTPLTEALCKCLNDFNSKGVNAFLSDISEDIRRQYPNIMPPSSDMIKKSLKILQKEGKVKYSSTKGYFLCRPSLESADSSSPSSTLKCEPKLPGLMTPDEVISRLHGSPTSSTESAYYGSNGAAGDTPNLMTPTSLNTVNWDFGGGVSGAHSLEPEGSDISLRRSSSLRIPTGKGRSEAETDKSSTGNFSRSKSLRMVNNKEKAKSPLIVDSSETQIKSEPVKKPSIFTKFFSRLSYNGSGNSTASSVKTKSDESSKVSNDDNKSPECVTKSTQTVNPVKCSSLGVLHRKSSKLYYKSSGSSGMKIKSSTLNGHLKCKPYGSPTSCMYCETLRTMSRLTSPKATDYCNLCGPGINSVTSTLDRFPVTRSTSNHHHPQSSVNSNCDKCYPSYSLTYCCSNLECTSSSALTHSPFYSSSSHHHQHNQTLLSSSYSSPSHRPFSSSPPLSPYSRFTLSPTLRPKNRSTPLVTSNSVNNNNNNVNYSQIKENLPSQDKFEPISIQTSDDDRIYGNGNKLNLFSNEPVTSKSLVTASKVKEISDISSSVNPEQSANKVETIKVIKDEHVTRTGDWSLFDDKSLIAELDETGLTIGNSFNVKIEFASPTSPPSSSQNKQGDLTSGQIVTASTTGSKGLMKSFTNFEEKSAGNLNQDGGLSPLPSILSKQNGIHGNRCLQSVTTSGTTSSTNGSTSVTTNVTNNSSMVNICTVTRTTGRIGQSPTKLVVNPANSTISTSTSSAESPIPNESSKCSTDSGSKELSEMVKSSGQSESESESPAKPISDIRQKVAQAKAAFFNGSDTAKVNSVIVDPLR